MYSASSSLLRHGERVLQDHCKSEGASFHRQPEASMRDYSSLRRCHSAPTKQAFDNVGLGLPVAQLLVKAALLMFSGGRAN